VCELSSEGFMGWGYYGPYIPVARRRANALREARRLAGKGTQLSPVTVSGRAIATTFWGKAWCENLESYSDFSNRLPRGRTYVRNGSVINLQIEPGKVTSLVSGSHLYRLAISIRPLATPRWKAIKQQCSAQIGSVVELLHGRLSKNVMEIVTNRENGLFPAPAEIEMSCSCPDWAGMCKHVAATLYGVASRLDQDPALLFRLRQVDHVELIEQAGRPAASLKTRSRKTIGNDQLADVFGIELDTDGAIAVSASVQHAEPKRDGRPLAPEEKKVNRTRKAQDSAALASGRSANARRRALTPQERKQIAETQRKRWEAVRQKRLPQNGNRSPLSPSSAKKNAKAKPAQSARSKFTRPAGAV
jgi:uncharacterized Zn finger protein